MVRSGHCDDGGCDGRSVHHEEDGHPRPPHWHAGLQTITVQGQGCESLNIYNYIDNRYDLLQILYDLGSGTRARW